MITSIETYTGHYLDYLNPQVEDVELADIARGLAQTCRFAGQTTRYYSVAEHAVYVSKMVKPEYAIAALHHDSHEAYVGDWPTPLKHVIGKAVFDNITDAINVAIAQKFGFDPELFESGEVKNADRVMLMHEAATLKYSHGIGEHWGNSEHYPPLAGVCWTPDEAEQRFIGRHLELLPG